MEIKASALVLRVLILCTPRCEVTSLRFEVTMDMDVLIHTLHKFMIRVHIGVRGYQSRPFNQCCANKLESEEQLSPSSGCQEVIVWYSLVREQNVRLYEHIPSTLLYNPSKRVLPSDLAHRTLESRTNKLFSSGINHITLSCVYTHTRVRTQVM